MCAISYTLLGIYTVTFYNLIIQKVEKKIALHENFILYFHKWMNIRRGIDNFITFYFMLCYV